MSQIDLESFQRLEEFPSFVSCIRCFGQSIIPPLVTPNHVHELRQLRAAAISKEAEILKRKRDHLREIKNVCTLSMLLENDHKSRTRVQESCALWYPSYHDNQEVSVAISKFPTSNIYSSVHTDSIVCSNVIGTNHTYDSNIIKDVLVDSGANISDCIECSHSNISLECSLCLAEWDQNLCSQSFTADLSPEVPCRTFSLLQNVSVKEGELNTTMEEAECESAICNQNQKNSQLDTDSESNTTCMTQSTDLEKFMELSCEFSSPDTSAVVWDSKTVSQQCTLSRSDDASSETIVNTENELTPCASTMAELTDNIEDELSNAEEVAVASDATMGAMKRAHSVDSYMKILQNCGIILNVKKSYSEPFNTNTVSNSADVATISSKANLLIKEDSKESDEAKNVSEKDHDAERSAEVSESDNVTEFEANVRKKKHVRKNSYTLDQPSSALMLAHAECTCNFDSKCISPHSSALKDTSEATYNSAFVKEKVDVPTSHPQMKRLSISDKVSMDVNLNKEEISSTVIHVFPNVEEDNCEKTDSSNAERCVNVGASGLKNDSTLTAERYLSNSFLENLNLSNRSKHQEYIQNICEELKTSHELRVKELWEEQNRQWLKLEDEFKEQEKLICEKLKKALESSKDLSSKNEDLKPSNFNSCHERKIFEHESVLQEELPASSSCEPLLNQMPIFDSPPSTRTSILSFSNQCSPALSPSEISVPPENVAALSLSEECQSSDKYSTISSEIVKSQQLFKDYNSPVACLKNNDHTLFVGRECMSGANGFSHPSSLVPHFNNLPNHYPSAIAVPIYNNCDKIATCFCDNAFELCRCCMSLNGISSSHPYSTLPSKEQNPASVDNNISSQPDSLCVTKLSPCSIFQSKPAASAYFSDSKTNLTNLSKKSNDCISAPLKFFENGEVSNVGQNDKNKRSTLPLSVKEIPKLPIDNFMSLCAEVSQNGTCISHNTTSNNKIIIDPNLMKKFEKLPAFVKGYLTRRLFKTKYVQDLIKNLKDAALLHRKTREDVTSESDSVSQRNLDFQKQLKILIMRTWDEFYDAFFTISTKERMSIISKSRNSKIKLKRIDQEQGTPPSITAKASESPSSKTNTVSSAALKVLERKKRPAVDSKTYNVEDMRKARSRSVLDMKTYTIDDLPNFRGRTQSSMSFKAVPVSPSSIYKNSVGTSLKRKTASTKPSGSRVHQKWVP